MFAPCDHPAVRVIEMMPADTSCWAWPALIFAAARASAVSSMSARARWQLRREFDAQLAAFVDTLLPAMNDLFAVGSPDRPEIPAADAKPPRRCEQGATANSR
jgi:hypothetical protein